MEASRSCPSLLCGARSGARRPRAAATLHVGAGVLGCWGGQPHRGRRAGGQSPVGTGDLWGERAPWKARGKTAPQEAAIREMETKVLPLQILLPLLPSIFQNCDARTALANSIIPSRLTEVGLLPICHFLREDCLFYLRKVKVATCWPSPTFKARPPLPHTNTIVFQLDNY